MRGGFGWEWAKFLAGNKATKDDPESNNRDLVMPYISVSMDFIRV